MSFFPQGTFAGIALEGSALNAFQLAENVTSQDIADVNTPGASRQQVDLVEAPPISGSPFYAAHIKGTIGDGVLVEQIQRIHDNSYDAIYRSAFSSQNFYQIEQNQLNAVQAAFGDPNAGISVRFSAFQSAITQLTTAVGTGNDVAARSNVLTQAQALTAALNNAANVVNQQKAQVIQQADTIVSTVNGILDQIAALNGQIRAATAAGDSPNQFEDERDHLIDQLSQYLSTQTSVQPDGSTLVSVNGQALVNDTVAYHLAPPTIGVGSNGAPVFKIDFATTPPAAPNAPGIPLGSGQLAGLQDLYNNKLSVYGRQLDAFAQSLAYEFNRITEDGYDQNGQPGGPLFVPIVSSFPISASNIKVGITDAPQLPAALASTAAGTLVQPLNSANNTVDTSVPLTNYAALANPPTAALTGTLSITIGGATQVFAYNTGAGGNADTINDFIANFNAAHLGVTASFDATGQKIVFQRDPGNEDLSFRAVHAAQPSDPTFTITDSNGVGGPPPNTYLLGVLGAAAIQGVTQNGSNAFAAGNNGVATQLSNLFASNVGVPPLQTTSPTAATAGTPITIALPAGVTNVAVGTVLTIDAQPGGGLPQENVTVTAVAFNPTTGVESVTFTPAQNHAAGFSVTTAQTQTLGQYYGQLVTQVGLDGQTAIQGTQTQTALAQHIDQVRQSIDGINIDEETQNLIKYQNAYQAAARTINVLDSLLRTVINNLGVGA